MDIESQLALQQSLEVTVWPTGDEAEELVFSGKILEKESPFFLIGIPPEREAELASVLRRGLTVGVLAHSNNPIIFYPKVEYFQEKPPRGYWLKLPSDGKFETVQRRSYVRVDMILPLEVEVSSEPPVLVKGMAMDMSGGGMRLTASRLFEKGEEVLIHIRFTKDQPLLKLSAVVIFSIDNKWSRSPQDAYITSCQFRNLNKQQQAAIMRECFRRELSLKNR